MLSGLGQQEITKVLDRDKSYVAWVCDKYLNDKRSLTNDLQRFGQHITTEHGGVLQVGAPVTYHLCAEAMHSRMLESSVQCFKRYSSWKYFCGSLRE